MRIAGEKGIAPEMFLAHDAFEERQVTLALEPQRQGGGFQADDFAGLGLNHREAI